MVLRTLLRCWPVLLGLWAAAAAPPAAGQGRPALPAVLARWVTAYDKGELRLEDRAVSRGKVDPRYGKGWVGGSGSPDLTHGGALRALLAHGVAARQPAVLWWMLRLASLGLVDDTAEVGRTHAAVRHPAHLALVRCGDTASAYILMRAAAGDFTWFRRPGGNEVGMRAAAILALGAMDLGVVRPALQRQLGDSATVVRLAAAEALGSGRHPRALRVLVTAMRAERDAIVALALIRGVRVTIGRHPTGIDTADLRAALHESIELLGRTDWRTDLEIVGFLGELRSAAAVPALIGILERSAAAAAGDPRVSRRLTEAAGEALRSLTGALIPANEPEKWRAFWKQVEPTFEVAPKKPLAGTRTSAGFFGLPVRGSNVVFVIDTSGSMKAGFLPRREDPEMPDGLTRLDMAKRELVKAVAGLPRDARFNVITFATDVTRWRRDLVPAAPTQRKRLAQMLDKLVPRGATNLFGALKEALGIRSLRLGARYGVPVDEVFVLSDGEPTAGELKDPQAILDLIRDTNRYSSVRINTLYMGGGAESDFMRRLAEENGGTYLRL
ncbi:MAG: HEAT repeat domain-containing protein [Planctomycetes bacterium]|nr:HEAT repeat domain-containing protein [Planctomycetota bacterium]